MIRIHQVDGGFVEIKRRKKRKSTGRKRGRPRKKHVLEPIVKSRKKPFSIILTSCGKQKECLKTFRSEKDAYDYFYTLITDNKKIRFPVKYINNNGLKEAKYELYILKRDDKSTDINSILLRNDLGEFVEHVTDTEGWQIIDKTSYDIEESFWVNGYDPFLQRKNFEWIFDNFIGKNIRDYDSFKNVLIYQNKFIVTSGENINIVFCKCVNDAIRMYNEVEKTARELKYKNIMFSGNIRDFSKQTISSWIDKLCEATGFSRHKIKRNSLRP